MLTVTGRQLIASPAVPEDVPAAMREYLNLSDGVDSNTFLSSLFLRAASIVESHTGLTVLPCTWRILFSGSGSALRLPLFPVRSAVSLSAADQDSVPPESFVLRSAPGYTWELVFPSDVSGRFTVDVNAGYASPEIPPPAAQAAIYAIAADLYEHREYQSEISLTESRAVKMALDTITFFRAGGV